MPFLYDHYAAQFLGTQGALPIHLFRQFCCRMYRSATMHSITDKQRRTDRWQYWLKV